MVWRAKVSYQDGRLIECPIRALDDGSLQVDLPDGGSVMVWLEEKPSYNPYLDKNERYWIEHDNEERRGDFEP